MQYLFLSLYLSICLINQKKKEKNHDGDFLSSCPFYFVILIQTMPFTHLTIFTLFLVIYTSYIITVEIRWDFLYLMVHCKKQIQREGVHIFTPKVETGSAKEVVFEAEETMKEWQRVPRSSLFLISNCQ